MAYPYDGSQCFGVGDFYEGHCDVLKSNRCLVGLGNKMGSGCGDPSCAESTPETNASQRIVGHLWGGCEDSPVELSDNQYFTPDGLAEISCRDNPVPLEELQKKFGMELGSTSAMLPDEDTMIAWARDMLPALKSEAVVETI